ncbi:hypothetical protein Pelo_407 [Pelomyxa schiedti]|nr:hypothetical protein Pelo_407 [Pelomyxa schiedti]
MTVALLMEPLKQPHTSHHPNTYVLTTHHYHPHHQQPEAPHNQHPITANAGPDLGRLTSAGASSEVTSRCSLPQSQQQQPLSQPATPGPTLETINLGLVLAHSCAGV